MTVQSTENPRPTPAWRLVLALAALLVAIAVWQANRGNESAPAPTEPGTAVAVVLEQQRPDTELIRREVTLGPNSSVYDAMQAAGRDGGAPWASVWRGSGEMTLLESLGGVASAGAAGGSEGLNWQFEVNGVYATRGAGALRLESGDRVLWKLAPYE